MRSEIESNWGKGLVEAGWEIKMGTVPSPQKYARPWDERKQSLLKELKWSNIFSSHMSRKKKQCKPSLEISKLTYPSSITGHIP